MIKRKILRKLVSLFVPDEMIYNYDLYWPVLTYGLNIPLVSADMQMTIQCYNAEIQPG